MDTHADAFENMILCDTNDDIWSFHKNNFGNSTGYAPTTISINTSRMTLGTRLC